MPDVVSPEDQVREVFAALDALDVPAMAALVSDDVRMRFGNGDLVEGREAFVQAGEAFAASIAGIRHEVHTLRVVDDAVIAEMDVHYKRLDGGELTLPCCNTFRVRDGLIVDYRIYMDITPLYA
jgi:ketosteroid isomerase-like protein